MRAPTSTASRARRADVDFLGVTGVFTDIPDDQRECPSIGMNGYAGTGGAINAYTASNQPMWDISNTTTWVSGTPHAELRHQLSPLVAPARSGDGVPRQLRLQRRVHRQSGRRHAARVLLGRRRVPAGGVQRAGSCRQPARVQLQVLRAVLPGRLARQLEADASTWVFAGTTATCPTRPTIAWRGATWTTRPAVSWWPISRWSAAASWTAPTTSTPAGAARRTRTASRCSPRDWDLPGARLASRR